MTQPLSLAAPAQADDYDAPSTTRSIASGSLLARDYNAWLAKISCERLSRGVDGDAYKSATSLQRNLPRNHPGPRFSSWAPRSITTALSMRGVLQRAGTRGLLLPIPRGLFAGFVSGMQSYDAAGFSCATAPPTTRLRNLRCAAPPGRARPRSTFARYSPLQQITACATIPGSARIKYSL